MLPPLLVALISLFLNDFSSASFLSRSISSMYSATCMTDPITGSFITGLICAAMGKSKKTENGYIASHAAFEGLMKKVLIIFVVLLAAALDFAVSKSAGIEFSAVMGATCLWFVASEGFSILENVASMGVPVPRILLSLLEIMKSKGEAPEETPAENKPEE